MDPRLRGGDALYWGTPAIINVMPASCRRHASGMEAGTHDTVQQRGGQQLRFAMSSG